MNYDEYNIENEIEIKETKRKKRKNKGYLKIICVCVASIMIGVLIGSKITSGSSAQDSQTTQQAEVDYSDVVSNAAETDSSSEAANSSSSATNLAVQVGTEMTASEIYELACQQVVGITTEVTTTNAFGQESSGSVAGTGFFITEDGYIATNYHVISTALSGNYPISVMLYNGDTYEAEYIGGDSDNDIAVLKIDVTGMSAATFADSNSMVVGEDVYVVGNALGELAYTMTSGLVSALDRVITTSSDSTGSDSTTMNMFQIDAAVNSGNSGGPVYNSKGQVIGIVTAKYSSTGVEGLGFAIPSSDASSLVSDIIEYGYVSGKPLVGIGGRTLDSSTANYYGMPEGVYVTSITEGGAADNAGIQQSDIITKLGDTDIQSVTDLNAALKNYSAGDTETITVYRNGEYLEFSITFDEKTDTSESSTEETTSESTTGSGQTMPGSGNSQSGNSGSQYGSGYGYNNFNQNTQTDADEQY